MEKRSLEELDKALAAMGMLTASQMISGNPLQRHAGVCDMDTFGQWLDMRHKELLRLKAGMLVDGKEDSELYEWVMAHHAAFSEVLVNFKSAIAGEVVSHGADEHEHS
ncbi:hypothetical protein LZT27_14665 [Aeromonas veronii]|uniref:hypothetical protein n=1 Tax=Aeromonas veronii TaxID=654 RepID=UPI002363D158|nr:hypothetical protein [Aeromonas veronii]MDD1845833.1 hypothetical protein [Aeromonas veronii]